MSRFPRVGRRPRVGAIVAAVTILLTGCGTISGTGSLTPDATSTMTVSSAAFSQNVLPPHFTCHGANISPPLDWTGAPSTTKSYAIVVDDAAAPITPYIYWIVFDIPAATTDIQNGPQLPPGAKQADNSLGRASYDPPCPDSPGHSYRFTVYALSTALNLPNGTSTVSAWMAIANAAIARGRITVTANP